MNNRGRTGTRWTRRKEAFVQAYLECGNGAEAARRAGYSERAAKKVASELLRHDPLVIQAVEDGRRALQERNQITVDSMIRQFDEDRAFAVRTENATAAVRASELKAKLAGLLVDRRDVRMAAGFKVIIEGLDADEDRGALIDA